jgi:hypothetical protein
VEDIYRNDKMIRDDLIEYKSNQDASYVLKGRVLTYWACVRHSYLVQRHYNTTLHDSLQY